MSRHGVRLAGMKINKDLIFWSTFPTTTDYAQGAYLQPSRMQCHSSMPVEVRALYLRAQIHCAPAWALSVYAADTAARTQTCLQLEEITLHLHSYHPNNILSGSQADSNSEHDFHSSTRLYAQILRNIRALFEGFPSSYVSELVVCGQGRYICRGPRNVAQACNLRPRFLRKRYESLVAPAEKPQHDLGWALAKVKMFCSMNRYVREAISSLERYSQQYILHMYTLFLAVVLAFGTTRLQEDSRASWEYIEPQFGLGDMTFSFRNSVSHSGYVFPIILLRPSM